MNTRKWMCVILVMAGLTGMVQAQSGTWLQTDAGPFDWGASTNWTSGTVASGAQNTATFSSSLTANQIVNLDAAHTIGNILFSSTGNFGLSISGANTLTLDTTSGTPTIDVATNRTLTISATISGNDGLQKNGSGALTLSAANTYTGTTTLSAGTLQLGNATSIGTSTLAMTNNTTLQLRNDSDTTFNVPFATPAGAVTYNFDVNNAGSAVTGKKLSLGNLTFAVNAANQINVTGGNSYALGLGTLSHPSGSGGPWAFTVNAATVPVTITKFSTGSYGTALALQGGNAITLNTFELMSNGNQSITVSGSGTVVTLGSATAANNRSGGSATYTLSSGTLNLTSTTSLANVYITGVASAPAFVINGGTLNNTSGSALTLGTLVGGTQNNKPTITLGGNFAFGTSDSTSANDLNLGTSAVALGNNRIFTVNGTTTLTLGGIVSGAYTLTKSGSGKLTLTGVNTYSGITTVNSGTLAVIGGGQLYSNANKDIANAITINSGGTIEFDNWPWGGSFGTLWFGKGNIVINGGTMRYVGTTANGWANRSFTIGANGATLESATSGQIWTVASSGSYTTLASNGGTLTLTGAGDGQIDQIIPGSGTVTKSGSGIWTLSGANTYTNATTINGGTLKLGATNVLAKTSQIVIGDGTLDASTYTNKLPTLDITTANAKINLGVGGALAFADSHAIDWTGGKLTITGAFVNGSSIRFANSSGLTETQLGQIKISGFASTWIDSNGYLFGKKGTLVMFY